MVHARRNYYARFHTHSYHCCREMHNNSRLDVKFLQSQWSMKCRSRAPGHGVCLKSVSRTTTHKVSYEPRHEKTSFLHICAKTKTQISFVVTAKLISVFVFATRTVRSLDFLNPKFQASSHLLWLYSPVCIRPGRKPQRPVFS